jgi:hypothetical protein
VSAWRGRASRFARKSAIGLASHYPSAAHSRWFEDIAGRHIGVVAAALPLDVVTAARARGRDRELEATVAQLLVEWRVAMS